MRCLNSMCGRDGLSSTTTVCPHCGELQGPLNRDLLAPDTLLNHGKYRIDSPLGRGGFGVSYRGTHLELEQSVAIKEYLPRYAIREPASPTIQSPAAERDAYALGLNRFRREGKILRQLRHPNVVTVHDLFVENGTAYLVMELVPGHPLRREIAEAAGRKVPISRVEEIAEALVSALSAVHEKGVYHLDISPENVMTRPGGEITLIDFGAARDSASQSRSTRAFRLEYAPLEMMYQGVEGPETDLFELGMVLYEMIVGKRAPDALERADVNRKWAPSGLPEPWQSLLSAALRMKRKERPGSVKEWWDSRARPEAPEPLARADAAPSPPAQQPSSTTRRAPRRSNSPPCVDDEEITDEEITPLHAGPNPNSSGRRVLIPPVVDEEPGVEVTPLHAGPNPNSGGRRVLIPPVVDEEPGVEVTPLHVGPNPNSSGQSDVASALAELKRRLEAEKGPNRPPNARSDAAPPPPVRSTSTHKPHPSAGSAATPPPPAQPTSTRKPSPSVLSAPPASPPVRSTSIRKPSIARSDAASSPPAPQAGSIPNPPITAVNPVDGAQIIFIPPGEFKMGDATFNNAPEHSVTLDGYWMYRTPVTVSQYRAFCAATDGKMPPPPDWGWKSEHPIVNVSWCDAKAYCDWAKASLPTEAEWEKAARGTDGRKYPWGNAFDPGRLWCSKAARGDAKATAQAGNFPNGASPYGCLDMAGNVWEWCADWYDEDYYKSAPSRNPTGPGLGQYRVVRGGSWGLNIGYMFRCGNRVSYDPTLRYIRYFGFRCCVRVRSA